MSAHRLPPYGRAVVAMLARHERPELLGGALVAACVWDIARGWPRIVVPDDPSQYRFDFAGGLDWMVVAPHGHAHAHVAAVCDALRHARAHVVAPVIFPTFDHELEES